MSLMYLKPKGEIMREALPAMKRVTKKVEYLKGGGVLTWFYGEPYPQKQLVYPEMFAILNPVKRVVPNFFRLLKKGLLIKFLAGLCFILPGGKKLRINLFKTYVDIFWSGLAIVAFKPEHYCKSAKEVRRALLKVLPQEEYIERLVDMFCLFWEYDDAYRVRFQDWFHILDQEKFLMNPNKELKRAFQIYLKRELAIKEKANFFKWLPLALYVPKYRRIAKEFIAELDFSKVRMDEGDFYWSLNRTDYDTQGLNLETRMRKRALMKLS